LAAVAEERKEGLQAAAERKSRRAAAVMRCLQVFFIYDFV
jgi:hypothetical protein